MLKFSWVFMMSKRRRIPATLARVRTLSEHGASQKWFMRPCWMHRCPTLINFWDPALHYHDYEVLQQFEESIMLMYGRRKYTADLVL